MRFEVRGAQEQGISVEALGEILKERGHEVTGRQEEAHICLWFEHREEPGYQIRKEGKEARIFWNRLPEAFRALGKVLEHGEEEAWSEENQGVKGHTGFMFDCSRNSVLKVEMVKRLIRQTALMGLEWFLLYTEDTYEVKGYPYFGALRGRYTEEEIRECDAYAALFGVEMIPCIQTLAHLRTALRWPAMEQYRDNMDILLAEEEKTYELIDAMLAAVSRMYRSRRVHLGMDEAFYLGYGNYRRIHGEVKQGELIRRHLDRVMKICEKYGLDPMIWSDMFFVTPGGGDYYNVPADYEWPEGEKPDRRTTLVYWDYEGHDPARYTRMARLHKKLTEQVCFAGGAWIWNGLAPNYAQAMDATKAAFAGLKDTGVEDSFFTLWQDNGAETPMVAGLPMMAFYSRCVYGRPWSRRRWSAGLECSAGSPGRICCSLTGWITSPEQGHIMRNSPIHPRQFSSRIRWPACSTRSMPDRGWTFTTKKWAKRSRRPESGRELWRSCSGTTGCWPLWPLSNASWEPGSGKLTWQRTKRRLRRSLFRNCPHSGRRCRKCTNFGKRSGRRSASPMDTRFWTCVLPA